MIMVGWWLFQYWVYNATSTINQPKHEGLQIYTFRNLWSHETQRSQKSRKSQPLIHVPVNNPVNPSTATADYPAFVTRQ